MSKPLHPALPALAMAAVALALGLASAPAAQAGVRDHVRSVQGANGRGYLANRHVARKCRQPTSARHTLSFDNDFRNLAVMT